MPSSRQTRPSTCGSSRKGGMHLPREASALLKRLGGVEVLLGQPPRALQKATRRQENTVHSWIARRISSDVMFWQHPAAISRRASSTSASRRCRRYCVSRRLRIASNSSCLSIVIESTDSRISLNGPVCVIRHLPAESYQTLEALEVAEVSSASLPLTPAACINSGC